MKVRSVAIVLFYDKEGNALVQDRRKISKWGEEFGFFGGAIEKGETPEQALVREIKEELDLELNNFTFFKRYWHEYPGIIGEKFVFLSPLPDLNNLRELGGQFFLTKISEITKLKLVPKDDEIIKDILEHLNII
jgi:8-oxo-dGTP diphosphatase